MMDLVVVALVGLPMVGLFVLVAWGAVGTRTLSSATPAMSRALKKHGFSEHYGEFVHGSDGRRVVVDRARATVFIPMRQAPFGAFPEEPDAEFTDDGVLVHFPPSPEQVSPSLARAERLQRQVEEAGAWHVAARHHGLRFRFASGLRHIQGKVDGIEVSVRQNGQVADVQVSVPQQVFVRPGKGDSGNPVLDLLVDSQGIPDAVVEPVLEVVHGRGGVIDRGVLRVSWTGDIKGCLDSVLAIARGLRGPATPTG